MKRSELDCLSTEELRQVILDATDVLATRANSPSTKSPVQSAQAEEASPGGLFTFGISGGSSPASFASAPSIFTPPASTKLFGGTGGGLFSSASGGLFGTSGAFFGGSSASTSSGGYPTAVASVEKAEDDDDGDGLVKEEEVTAVHGWTPSISLEVCDTIATGEESEEQLYSQRSKLYRFRDGEWKERGLGDSKLLKSKDSSRVRFLLRQEKTGKVVANFFPIDHPPYCQLSKNADSEKIWVWCTQDWSDGELKVEQLALKFGKEEQAEKFSQAFEDAKLRNAAALDKKAGK